MVDFHSHVLPGMDDGSADVGESSALLTELSHQNIDTVAATPHFIAGRESVDRFLRRREESFLQLKSADIGSFPELRLGAETEFYDGISRLDELTKLCIEGTDILLLEMPNVKWSGCTVRELYELVSSGTMTVMLAHVERCLFMQDNEVVDNLLHSGVIMQSNASFFINRFTRRKALALLNNNIIHVLGSDCHNVTARPPRLGQALEVIQRRLGESAVRRLNDTCSRLLNAQKR